MPGALSRSPAEVVGQMLVDMGLGAAPPDLVWPVHVTSEPASPDDVITVYDTQGRSSGRTMPDGEVQEHHGIQVRVRSAKPEVGYAKARAIAVAMDQDVYDRGVTVLGFSFLVHSLSRTTDVIHLGYDSTSRRRLYTTNFLAMIRAT